MRYALTTRWVLAVPLEDVWTALTTPEAWPRWWRYVQSVERLRDGDAQGIGAVRRYTWSSRLPYRLTFDMTTTAMTRPTYIEGVARGELRGVGRWRLGSTGRHAHVEYEWTVTTGKRWMNALAPLLAPVFEWNHREVMAEGGRGLARHLGVPLPGHDGAARARR
ncbi:MAG TPA: SRPBCC family protein [Casimicrobiaceae bacterium]